MTETDFSDFIHYDYGNMKIAINNLAGKIESFGKSIENRSDAEIKDMLSVIKQELKQLVETHENFPNVARNW